MKRYNNALYVGVLVIFMVACNNNSENAELDLLPVHPGLDYSREALREFLLSEPNNEAIQITPQTPEIEVRFIEAYNLYTYAEIYFREKSNEHDLGILDKMLLGRMADNSKIAARLTMYELNIIRSGAAYDRAASIELGRIKLDLINYESLVQSASDVIKEQERKETMKAGSPGGR